MNAMINFGAREELVVIDRLVSIHFDIIQSIRTIGKSSCIISERMYLNVSQQIAIIRSAQYDFEERHRNSVCIRSRSPH